MPPVTTILQSVIDKNKNTIHEVVALRTATFGEINAFAAPSAPLSELGAKLQLAAYKSEISCQELKLASLMTGEDIPCLKLNSPINNIKVGVVVVAQALPAGIEDKRDFVGKPMLSTSNHNASRGWPFRMADGTKVYVPASYLTKEMLRPATEAEAIATVDGLLAVRPTLTVKLFNDKDADLSDDNN